jgi:hypothetical protein
LVSRTRTAVSGLAFSALTLAACLLMSGGPARKPDAEVVAYWADSGHRNRIGIAFALVILACFCFLWFLDGLQLDRLGFAGGVFWSAMFAIGAAVYAAGATVLGTVVDIENTQVDVGVVRSARDIYWTAVSAGAAGGAVLVLSSALRARRRALRWLQIIVAVAILGFGAQEGWNDRAISSMLTASVALVLAWAFATAAGLLRRSADLAP